jgi:hypothetical protein
MNATRNYIKGLLPEQNMENSFDYTYAQQALQD